MERKPFVPKDGEDDSLNSEVRQKVWDVFEDIRRKVLITQDWLEIGDDKGATLTMKSLIEDVKKAAKMMKNSGLSLPYL